MQVGGWRTEDGNPQNSQFSTSKTQPPTSQPPTSTGLDPRTAATFAYLAGPFSGALMLFAESRHRDVRFHAWQSIVGLGGLGLLLVATYALAVAALFVSAAAVSAVLVAGYVLWIVLVVVWAICLYKAHAGGRWRLPIAGSFADRHAGS